MRLYGGLWIFLGCFVMTADKPGWIGSIGGICFLAGLTLWTSKDNKV